MTHAALVALERLLLPNCCVACGRLVGPSRPDELVCTTCLSRMRTVPLGCVRCRQPLPPVGPCRFCAAWPPTLRWAASAVWLGDEAREIVHHLKYGGYPSLARLAAEVVVRRVAHPGRSVLVPIPLGRRRLRQRGYNQATELARALGGLWSLPVAPSNLERVRETKTQTELSPDGRRENVKGAFAASRCSVRLPVILIDDVLTTGATLAAAASAMARAGWGDVGAVTFARAMPLAVQLDQA